MIPLMKLKVLFLLLGYAHRVGSVLVEAVRTLLGDPPGKKPRLLISKPRKKRHCSCVHGYQAQVTKQHWSASKKEAAKLEKQAILISRLEAENDQLKKSYDVSAEDALTTKQLLEQQIDTLKSKDEALTLALHKISTMSRGCRQCIREVWC